MRVLVIGTSNSIFKGGYVDSLRQSPDVTSLVRTGPGGSTSIIIPYFGLDIDFSLFDMVVIDTSINDGAFASWGKLSSIDIMNNLEWLCCTAINSGCFPCFVLMPNKKFLGQQDPSFESYFRIAQKYKAGLVNGYKFAFDYAESNSVDVGTLFIDDLHLRVEISALLAPAILDSFRTLSPHRLVPNVDFRKIEAGSLGLPLIVRQTSLMSSPCGILPAQQVVTIPISEEESLVGVVFNAGQTSGVLNASGRRRSTTDIRTHYYGKNDLVVIARQITPPVGPQQGNVYLSLGSEEGSVAEIVGVLISRDVPAD